MHTSRIIALGLALACGGASACAEERSEKGLESPPIPALTESSHAIDAGAMDHGGMTMGQHGMSTKDQHAHMQAMHAHSKMMQGITDEVKLGEEMKKHMRMMDEMMETMMPGHAAPPSTPPAASLPSGSKP